MINNYLSRSFFLALLTFSIGQVSYSSTSTTNLIFLEVNNNQWPKYLPLDSYGTFSVRVDKGLRLTEQAFLLKSNQFFNLSEHNTFVKVDQFTDKTGISHTTYQHYVGKYPVEGQMMIVHSENGNVKSVNGTIINIENAKSKYSLRSTVNQKTAIDQKSAVTIAFKANKIDHKIEEVIEPVQTVFVKVSDTEPLFVLAHKVRVDNIKTSFFSKEVFVDVEDGEIVNEVSLIPHVDAKGDGFYRKNLQFEVTKVGTTYQMIDIERKVITYDATDATDAYDIYGKNLTPASYVNTNFPKNTNNDVHWGLTKTYDYFKNIHSRLSYDGKEGYVTGYNNPVVFNGDSSGFPYNAVAMGAPYNMVIFGNGDGEYMNPLTTLDVIGHEFTHLVINNNGRGGLRYQGESGALNEGFADIFGTSIEHYTVNDANWELGEGILLTEQYSYTRNMQYPKENNKYSEQPNTYKGQYWAKTGSFDPDAGGVHTNSGVLNYWYYLLTEGGNGINDLGNDFVVFGIGIEKSEKIAYALLNGYLTSNSQFQTAYSGALLAAEDLYGKDSDEYFAVHDAWYAVGLGERRANMGKKKIDLIDGTYTMYPNPVVNGEFNVLTKDVKATVTFYNMLGQKVSDEFLVEQGENKLNIGFLSTGNYMVIYESNGKKTKENIIVK